MRTSSLTRKLAAAALIGALSIGAATACSHLEGKTEKNSCKENAGCKSKQSCKGNNSCKGN